MQKAYQKKFFLLQIVLVLYLFLIIPLLIFNLHKKQHQTTNAEVLSSQTPGNNKNTCTSIPSNIIVIIDTSISKLDQAKSTAAQLIAAFSQNSQNSIGLITTGKTVTINQPLANDSSHLQSIIATVSATQDTCLQCAVQHANQILSQNKVAGDAPPSIILLTDGYPNYTTFGPQATASAQQQTTYAVTNAQQTNDAHFYTIAFGANADTNFLTSLAANGSFYLNPTQDQLQDIIAHVAQTSAQGTIKGTIFLDRNFNGVQDLYEQPLSGQTIQITKDGQSTPDQIVMSDITGTYTAGNLCNGTYHVSLQQQTGWTQTGPLNPNDYTASLTNGHNSITDENFGLAYATVPTPQPTTLSFTVLLDGIGAARDDKKLSNRSPKHTTHLIATNVYTLTGTPVATATGTITYNDTVGAFEGSVNMYAALKQDSYLIALKTDNFAPNTVPGIITLTPQQNNQLPPVLLLTGDANNDGKLDILDYNLLLNCYSTFRPKTSCDEIIRQEVDFNDDGTVNQQDYELFLEDIKKQNKQ